MSVATPSEDKIQGGISREVDISCIQHDVVALNKIQRVFDLQWLLK